MRSVQGPAFLPSEHDELPPGVAFMVFPPLPIFRSTLTIPLQTLHSHSTPITSLDFSEPYGTLVSASQDDSQPRVWDLLSGTEIGRLRGHRGMVKCVQVEDHVCLTGGEDGNVRLWDLRRIYEEDDWGAESEVVSLSDVPEEDEGDGDGEPSSSVRSGRESVAERDDLCARVLEGHSKAVTALYFEDDCLVSVLSPAAGLSN